MDELSLRVQELDAKPNVGDVVLARHHQIEGVALLSFNQLLLALESVGACFTPLVKELFGQEDGFLSETPSVGDLLADVICASHGPLWNLPLDCKLDVKLVINFQTSIDSFGTILTPTITQFDVAFILGIIATIVVFSIIGSPIVAQFFHRLILSQLLCSLVSLTLVQTYIAEEYRSHEIDV